MSYLQKWVKQKFEVELEKDERIEMRIRKHWLTLILPAIKVFLAIFIPGVFIDFIFRNVVLLIIFLAWFAFILAYAIYHSVRYYYDSFIITNKRIIDIDQKGVFSRSVSETTFDRIQDATYEVKGFWGTTFDYGNVMIQTAGTQENLELSMVPHPQKVQERILDLQEKLVGREKNVSEEGEKELTAEELIQFIQSVKAENKSLLRTESRRMRKNKSEGKRQK